MIERIQHNFIISTLRGLGWTVQPLPLYDSRCLWLRLEVLSDRRKIASALLVRDILCRRIESAYLADLIRLAMRDMGWTTQFISLCLLCVLSRVTPTQEGGMLDLWTFTIVQTMAKMNR
jgi:hypothetical protein